MTPSELWEHYKTLLFDDPAHATGTEEEQLAVFRRVRDEIKAVFSAYAAGRREVEKLAATIVDDTLRENFRKQASQRLAP